jgi:hypothetical protein
VFGRLWVMGSNPARVEGVIKKSERRLEGDLHETSKFCRTTRMWCRTVGQHKNLSGQQQLSDKIRVTRHKILCLMSCEHLINEQKNVQARTASSSWTTSKTRTTKSTANRCAKLGRLTNEHFFRFAANEVGKVGKFETGFCFKNRAPELILRSLVITSHFDPNLGTIF